MCSQRGRHRPANGNAADPAAQSAGVRDAQSAARTLGSWSRFDVTDMEPKIDQAFATLTQTRVWRTHVGVPVYGQQA